MKFELVTPSELVVSTEATYVQAPGTEGDFGVLDGHMPLISTLREDATVTVTDKAGKKHAYTVGKGFVDVTPTSVTVLAERVTQA